MLARVSGMDGPKPVASPERLEAVAHGRVQGVGYRSFVVKEARRLAVTGYARNLPGWRMVEVVAEGARIDLELLIAALHKGPWIAKVERVTTLWLPSTGQFADFDIRT